MQIKQVAVPEQSLRTSAAAAVRVSANEVSEPTSPQHNQAQLPPAVDKQLAQRKRSAATHTQLEKVKKYGNG